MSAWYYLSNYNILPYPGGWLDQPLWLLTIIEAIDITVKTYRYINAKDHEGKSTANWSVLNGTQNAIIREFGH